MVLDQRLQSTLTELELTQRRSYALNSQVGRLTWIAI